MMKTKIVYLVFWVLAMATMAIGFWAASRIDRTGTIYDPPAPKPAWKTRPMYQNMFR